MLQCFEMFISPIQVRLITASFSDVSGAYISYRLYPRRPQAIITGLQLLLSHQGWFYSTTVSLLCFSPGFFFLSPFLAIHLDA